MTGYLGPAILIVAFIAVEFLYGPIGAMRLVGGFFLLFAAWASALQRSVSAGRGSRDGLCAAGRRPSSWRSP
jgi:hypothetical protein